MATIGVKGLRSRSWRSILLLGEMPVAREGPGVDSAGFVLLGLKVVFSLVKTDATELAISVNAVAIASKLVLH